MENRLIHSFTMALGFAFVLAATDMQIRPEWLHFRLGGIGGLIFVFVCVRLTDPDEAPAVVISDLFWITVRAALAGVGFALILPPGATDQYVALFVLCLGFVLLYTIIGRLTGLRRENRKTSFYRWLIGTRSETLEDFIEALQRLPLTREHLVVRGSDLERFDDQVMASVLGNNAEVGTLGVLRSAARSGVVSSEGADQLTSLLQENRMTHVTLLSSSPPTFLLLNLPQFASTHNPVLEVALLHKYATLLPQATS